MATLVYLLTGGSLLEQRADIYLYIPDATGLEKGSPVRYDRITVGKVARVELSGASQPGRVVKVTLTIRRDRLVSIPADSWAQITSETLIGDKFVDLRGGTGARRLHGGDELAFKDQPELLQSLDLTQFSRQLKLVEATLDDIEQGRSQFGKFVQGSEFYSDLQRRLKDLRSGIHDAVNTTSTVGSLLTTDRLHRQLADFLANLDRMLANIQSGQGAAGQLLRDSASYDQWLATVQQFRRSLVELHSSELMQSDTAYTAWNRQLAGWIQSVDELNANPQFSTTILYDNLNGAAIQRGGIDVPEYRCGNRLSYRV